MNYNNTKSPNKNYHTVQETNTISKLSYEYTTRRMGRWAGVTSPKPKPFFPLERGTTKLINEPICIVSKRIDDWLRIHSIQATFDVDNAVATCKTADDLQYKIFLYAGPNNKNDDRNRNRNRRSTSTSTNIGTTSTSTYVEIVKMKGCGFQFTKERKTIINAAKAYQEESRDEVTMTMMIPPDLIDSYVPPSIHELKGMLDRTIDQLHTGTSTHSDNRKVLLFALQNLESMTTPDKSYPQNAYQMSKLIMYNQHNIRDLIVAIYATVVSTSTSTATSHDMINESSERVGNSCLHILINALRSFYGIDNDNSNNDSGNGNGRLLDQQGEEIKYFIHQLIPSLLTSVNNYKDTPHNACLAMTILHILIQHSPETCILLRERNIIAMIEEAELYGSMEHLKLETIARCIIEALQSQP